MERKKIINLIIYIALIVVVVIFVYKNNGLIKRLTQNKIELRKATKKIVRTQEEYKKLELEYTKIKEDLKIIKQDFIVLKDAIKTNSNKNITEVKDITTKLSDIIIEQEKYQFPVFDSITTSGPLFKIN